MSTIKGVAEQAGESMGTVSRVFSGSVAVSAERSADVYAAIERAEAPKHWA